MTSKDYVKRTHAPRSLSLERGRLFGHRKRVTGHGWVYSTPTLSDPMTLFDLTGISSLLYPVYATKYGH